ncbi:MAG: oligosaccharide flippase family protein [Cyanobacteria bacterium J06554_1]
MLKKLFSDIYIYTLPTILSRGISFLILPIYTRILSTSDYGILDLVMVFGNLVNLTISLEISQGIARFYPDEKDVSKQKLYASSAFWFSTFCYILFLIISLSFSSSLSNLILQDSNRVLIFRIGLVYIFFNGLVYFIQSQLRWEFRSKQYAILSTVVSFSIAIGSVFLGYFLNWKLHGVLLGMLIAHLIGYIYGIIILRESIDLRVDLDLLSQMLKFSSPLVPAGIAVFISTYIDRIMINHFLSLDEVGIYSLGFRLASITTLIIIGFQRALTPLIYSHYSEEDTPRHLALIFRLFIAISLVFILCISIFSKEILWLITNPNYYSASTVIVFLALSILFANMYIFTPGISIVKRSYIIFWINFAGAVLNVVFNWLLIPTYGLMGGAFATLLGSIFVFLAYLVFSQRFYYVPHSWKHIGIGTLFIAIACILSSLINFGIPLNLFLKALIVVGATVFLLWIKLISIDELRGFIKPDI